MADIRDHPVSQFVILTLAVMAGFIAAKAAVSVLPDTGIPGAIKAVVKSA